MKFLRLASVLSFISLVVICSAQPNKATNPLLVHSNNEILFDSITPSTIKEALAFVIKLSDDRVYKIKNNTNKAKSLSMTLQAFDELSYDISELSTKLGLIASTFVDDSTRETANEQSEKLSAYYSKLLLDEGLYKALKMYAESPFARMLKPNQTKFLKETIIYYEKSGMKLDKEGRKEMQTLNEKLISLGSQFDKNIGESRDSISFTEKDLKGVPTNTMAKWKRADGSYVVVINSPNYNEVMNNADLHATRHTMFLHYNNRAYPANIKVLDSLFFYRNKFAQKLGFKSYAEYAVVDKMAKSPAAVWKFENNLAEKLTPFVTAEMNTLKDLKKQMNPASVDTIFEWDISYYKKKLLDKKYHLSPDEVKQYFEMNNTLKGMFTVYQKLFGIDIKEVQNQHVWYSKVRSFDMYKDSQKIGSFYLDLYPRANKYTHFACFPISEYRLANGKEMLPVSALICNFSEGTANEPSLLYHSDVVTLFHEFGHLVHSMLGRSDIASQGPFTVKGDFTEAPSQFLENWVWEYESLKLFAKHYKTGKPLPVELFNKMKQTQQVGIAIQYSRQVYLGMLDFTYEDKYEQAATKGIMEVAKDLNAIRQVPFAEGAHQIASFGHLNGYGANYYGYLWSKVFAEDMFSVFKKKGVMDADLGISYRKNILEKAATMDEKEMIVNFLGREPNATAFLESLGIK